MRRLHVSANRRFLVWEDSTPFFWLGDTAWELFHRATLQEAERYLQHRRAQGFTVIHAVALAELDGLNTPNAYGQKPLHENDPLRPNDAYFRHLDAVIARAGEHGLVIALLPTWGDKVERCAQGIGPVVFNPDNARGYGEWIGRRYRDAWNLVWVNGGDRQGGGGNHRVWDALGRGIKSVDPHHLMTFHPPGGDGGHSSSEWFHDAEWLDFNLAQSGHERKHLPNYAIVARDYLREPVKPCLDGEPRYEDHGVNWRPFELGWFDDYDIRQAAYWAMFAGAFGHTYGCHAIWQFLTDRRQPVGWARRSWRDALELPGAGQMQHLRRLIESRPLLSRRPDQSLLAEIGDGAAHCRACRGEDYAFVYLPQGGPARVRPGALAATHLRVWWYDPRTGAAGQSELRNADAVMEFTAPWSGPCADWVLVLDDADQDYPPPGNTLNSKTD